MKIVLELNDQTLHALVQSQVGKAVSEYTERAIQDLVSDIVKTKLERFDKTSLPAVMENAAKSLILAQLPSNDWTRSSQPKSYLADAAVSIIKQVR